MEDETMEVVITLNQLCSCWRDNENPQNDMKLRIEKINKNFAKICHIQFSITKTTFQK